jgi:hypothetical protein
MFGRGFDSRHLHSTGRECKKSCTPFFIYFGILVWLDKHRNCAVRTGGSNFTVFKINFSGKVEPRIKDFSSNVATAKSFGRFLRK